MFDGSPRSILPVYGVWSGYPVVDHSHDIDLDDLDPDTSSPLLMYFSTSATCCIYSCKLKRAYIDQVVGKLSLHENGRMLKHEASIYEQLKLGDRMPRFFGLYELDSDAALRGYCD